MSGGEWSHVLDPLRALGFAFWSAAVAAVLQLAIILGSHDGITWWRLITLLVVMTGHVVPGGMVLVVRG